MGMRKGRLCGEDAFRRLCADLDASQVEAWFASAEQMIHHAIPPDAIADWDSTVVPRYSKQEDAAIGYNPQKSSARLRDRRHAFVTANGVAERQRREHQRLERVVVERTLKPLNPSPQGSFWQHGKEDFSAYVIGLTAEETDGFQIVQLYRQTVVDTEASNGADACGFPL